MSLAAAIIAQNLPENEAKEFLSAIQSIEDATPTQYWTYLANIVSQLPRGEDRLEEIIETATRGLNELAWGRTWDSALAIAATIEQANMDDTAAMSPAERVAFLATHGAAYIHSEDLSLIAGLVTAISLQKEYDNTGYGQATNSDQAQAADTVIIENPTQFSASILKDTMLSALN